MLDSTKLHTQENTGGFKWYNNWEFIIPFFFSIQSRGWVEDSKERRRGEVWLVLGNALRLCLRDVCNGYLEGRTREAGPLANTGSVP